MTESGSNRGSLLVGFVLGWTATIATFAAIFVFYLLSTSLPDHGIALAKALDGVLWALPLVAMTALIVRFAVKGKPKSAAGVGIAFASMVALSVLLFDAGVGLVANGHL